MAALTPANALALEVSARYGLRIGDVLALRTEDVTKQIFTISEQKTGKKRRVCLGKDLQFRLMQQAGKTFIFENRLDPERHRTRQAVYKDIRRACKLFRIPEHVSPHSARKQYAVDALKRFGSIQKVQQLLQHESEAVTMLYALADKIQEKKRRKGKKMS